MGIEQGIKFITDVSNGSTFLSLNIILPIGLILITTILITRDKTKWLSLFFPVSAGWYIIGVDTNMIILLGSGLAFIVDALSISTIGNIIGTIGESIRYVGSKTQKVIIPTDSQLLEKQYNRESKKLKKEIKRKEMLDKLAYIRDFDIDKTPITNNIKSKLQYQNKLKKIDLKKSRFLINEEE